jgi:hypothetical protein
MVRVVANYRFVDQTSMALQVLFMLASLCLWQTHVLGQAVKPICLMVRLDLQPSN